MVATKFLHLPTGTCRLVGFPNFDRISTSSGNAATLSPRMIGLGQEGC